MPVDIKKLILQKYTPTEGMVFYLYRTFSGNLFVTTDSIWSAEKVATFVWSTPVFSESIS